MHKGVPLVNALVLVLCEYRRKLYIIKNYFGLHFCLRQYGSLFNFNHFEVIG